MLVGEGHFRNRERPAEHTVPEMGKTRQRLPVRTEPEAGVDRPVHSSGERRLLVAVQDAGIQYLSVPLRLHREMRESQMRSFVRSVEDLRVDKSAVSGKADAPAADAAQRERDLPCFSAFISKKIAHFS